MRRLREVFLRGAVRAAIMAPIAFSIMSCAPGEFVSYPKAEAQYRAKSGTAKPEIKKNCEKGGVVEKGGIVNAECVRDQDAAKKWLETLPEIIKDCTSRFKDDYVARKDCILQKSKQM